MSGDAGLMPSVEQDPIWDKEALTLIVGENPELHQRLMDKFLPNAEALLSEICSLAEQGDTETCAKIAHQLKSSSRSVGAMRVSSLCQHLEKSGKAQDEAGSRSAALALQSAYAEFLQALQQ